jgi:two-component system, LytTR family, response regulator
MLTAFLVDDEPLAVQRLQRLLDATGRVRLAGATTDPDQAAAFLSSHAVDVLFLDVQMPGLTGFELLDRVASGGRQLPQVVFTTAYDQYALRAFDASAVDYLLKPIDPDRLARALDKAEQLQTQAAAARPDVRALARELAAELSGSGRVSPVLQSETRPLLRIASRVGERTTVLDVAKITHFFSKDKLTFAVHGGREHAIDYTLAELDEKLDPRRFLRIHRATIVNTQFVQELHPAVDGGLLVKLKDERMTELSVARDRVRDLKQRLGI